QSPHRWGLNSPNTSESTFFAKPFWPLTAAPPLTATAASSFTGATSSAASSDVSRASSSAEATSMTLFSGCDTAAAPGFPSGEVVSANLTELKRPLLSLFLPLTFLMATRCCSSGPQRLQWLEIVAGLVDFIDLVIMYARTSRSCKERIETSAKIAAGKRLITEKASAFGGDGGGADDDEGDGCTFPLFLTFISLWLAMERRICRIEHLDDLLKSGSVSLDEGCRMPRSVKNNQPVEAEVQEIQEAMETRFTTNNIRMSSVEAMIGDLQRGHASLQERLTELKFELVSFIAKMDAKLEPLIRTSTEKGESSNRHARIEHTHHQYTPPPPPVTFLNTHTPPKFPKLAFPRFDGMNPRGWVRKCEQYFELCPIHEEYKVSYASVHFDAHAECWYAAYIKPLGRVGWEQFVRDLYVRFSLTNGISVMGDFNRLVQTGSVDDYFNRFESMRAQVVQKFDYLDEGYFCASFIGGLKPEIKSRVEQFEANSLLKAILIARREEVAIQNLFKVHKSIPSANLNFNHTKTNHLLSATTLIEAPNKPKS
ncbi:hypothetical protein RJ640_002944, partial [Escallonia rubra]